ncbi:MAG: chromosome partitioning protein [Parvicellaceae bacterium]|jgi:chromosome partitioning protein
MTKVISFISRKGGTGKTTNAINLSTSLNELKKKVLLVETDTNYTLNSLRKIELFKMKKRKDTFFEIIGSKDNRVAEEILSLKKTKKYDYIIVDSAGKTTDKGIRELCLESDMVLVTTSLTQNDLLVAFQTIKDLKPATELNKNLKLCILPNRIHSLTRMATVKAQLAQLETEVIDTYVPQRKNYTLASTIKADRRYKNVAKQIIKQLEA